MKAENFKTPGGDTLADLNQRNEDAIAELSRAMEKLNAKREELKPFEEAVESASQRRYNIQTRLNIFWRAFRSR